MLAPDDIESAVLEAVSVLTDGAGFGEGETHTTEQDDFALAPDVLGLDERSHWEAAELDTVLAMFDASQDSLPEDCDGMPIQIGAGHGVNLKVERLDDGRLMLFAARY